MKDLNLDYWEEGEQKNSSANELILLRRFSFSPQANLYAARLKEVGIPSVLSNQHMASMLSLDGGIRMMIRQKDYTEALEVIAQLDKELQREPADFSYHDADLEDIAFEKSLRERHRFSFSPLFLLILTLILFLVLRALWRAAGIVPNGDAF
jgi:hypothetical protein